MTENEKQEVGSIEDEKRVDEFAISIFETMGLSGRLPDTLVEVYNEYKRRKDKMMPGRISPEGFAFILLIADWADGRIHFGAPAETEPTSES
jgi:hypothetical protein